MNQVRIGIVGLGNMGTGHAQYLYNREIEGALLSAVCDVNPARLDYAANTFGDAVARFDNFEALKNSGLIDLVLIATPHYFHPVYAMEALQAGLHVLSEKPIGVYTNKVQELNAQAEKSDKIFAVMFNQRTNLLYQKVRQMVRGGELGELKRVVWTITNWYRPQAYYNSGTWRATWKGEGGGVLLNQCPHNLDLLQWICGMPKRIRAFCYFGKYHNIEVEDDVTAFFEFEGGATGAFITTTGETPGANRLEISGNKGKIIVEDGKLIFHRLKTDEREFNRVNTEGFASPECEIIELPAEGEETAHRGITQNVVNAILKGEPLIARGEEGICSLTLSNAMHLSAWTDDWVNLPIDGDLYYQYLQEKIMHSKEKTNVQNVVLDTAGSFNQQQ